MDNFGKILGIASDHGGFEMKQYLLDQLVQYEYQVNDYGTNSADSVDYPDFIHPIASDINDPDDGKLYVWNGTGFTYVADLSGSQGIKGDTGEKGDKGDKGDTGDQGFSAYQVAVNAGFSGSVDQWLASLVGAKGDKGENGKDAVINVVTKAQYDALTDKSGVYFIEG